jgi:C1A family cysteine protease
MKPKRTIATKHLRGWVPDLPDHRDFLYADLRQPGVRLPSAADLRPGMSPVENQGQLGSCTANALAGALEFLEVKSGQPLVDLSRLFIYYNERAIEHTVASDSGAMIRDGIKTLAAQGVCPEKKWPYVVSAFAKKPSAACYTAAKGHVIQTYHRIVSLSEMRACLAEGYPFVFGFSVYESFESATVARTGVANMPKPRERQLGGHAVCAVGYDDKSKRLLVRNSWGPAWGMEGYFTLPYDYVSNRNLSDDFWTVRS